MSRPKAPFKTKTPQISDATIAHVRAAAHRYVLAGGSIFPGEDLDHTEHIGNVMRHLSLVDSEDKFGELMKTLVPDYTTHETLWSAAWTLVFDRENAAFLFGALVALETAALTSGQAVTIPAATPKQR